MNTFSMRASFLYIVLAFTLISGVPLAHGAVSVSPAVLDYKTKPREILKETVTVVNPTDRYVKVYPVVNNVRSVSGREEFADPSRADLSDSLANWIFFPMGALELEPGEHRTIPFEIRVNLTATKGIYHASLSFPEGPDRDAATPKALSAPALIINLEVEEVVTENLQLTTFVPERRFFFSHTATLRYELENLGNRTVVPAGDILIYDKNGKEAGSVSTNEGKFALEPGTKKEFQSSWRPSGFGQYKAVISLRYGEKAAAQIQDTIFFWSIPWQKAALFALLLCLGFMSIAFYISKRLHRIQYASGSRPGGNLSSAGIPHVVDLRHPADHDA
jgi:hypothetical protein